MYFVSADQFQPRDPRPQPKKMRRTARGPYEKWVKLREKMLREDVGRRTRVKWAADFLKQILPPSSSAAKTAMSSQTEWETPAPPPPPLPPTAIYEAPRRRSSDAEDETVERDVSGTEQYGEVAGSYLKRGKSLDTQYGIRKESDGTFMIGDSVVTVDDDSDVWLKGRHFKGTPGLWELLARKNVRREIITPTDLKTYKKILTMTNAHLEGYEPGRDIHIERGPKFQNIIASLFASGRKRGQESALARRWAKYD
jgi:hypothetical protein